MCRDFGCERLQSLCDGIFAVAMTLLLTTFDILSIPSNLDHEKFLSFLIGELPDLLHFIESVFLVGTLWIVHHQLFHLIRRIDYKLIWLNLIGMSLVVLIPVTNNIVGDYGFLTAASVLFEMNMFLAGIFFYLSWLYVRRNHRLLKESLTRREATLHHRQTLVIPVVSLIAMALSCLYARWGTAVYLFTPMLLWPEIRFEMNTLACPEEAEDVPALMPRSLDE